MSIPPNKAASVAYALALVLSPPSVGAHTFTAPSAVRASPDGSFSYTAVFAADGAAGVDVAGAGFNALVNVEPPQRHGDAFCSIHLDPGEKSPVDVEGSLVDIAQGGLVEAWFAPCDGPSLFARTAILPPGGPRRFVITGHPPLSEIQVGSFVAKGRRFKFKGTALLILEGGADERSGGAHTIGVALDVTKRQRADRSLYKMRSRKGTPVEVNVRIATRGAPETVHGARIDYTPSGGKKIRVRGPSSVRADYASAISQGAHRPACRGRFARARCRQTEVAVHGMRAGDCPGRPVRGTCFI